MRSPDQYLPDETRAQMRSYHQPLLALANEKRNAFIADIAQRMKPLGFRKRGNIWNHKRPDEYEVTLWVQKSLSADCFP